MVFEVRGDEVRLVDQHQIAALDVVGALVDALDAGEQDLRVQIALVQPGRVDAGRGLRPQPDHLAVVLRDQLLDVGDDENSRVGPVGDGAGGKGCKDKALARPHGQHDQRIAGILREVAVDRLDRRGLIGAELDHAALASAAIDCAGDVPWLAQAAGRRRFPAHAPAAAAARRRGSRRSRRGARRRSSGWGRGRSRTRVKHRQIGLPSGYLLAVFAKCLSASRLDNGVGTHYELDCGWLDWGDLCRRT